MTTSAELETSAMRGSWLFGRAADLLLGCGFAYVLSLPLLFMITAATGATAFSYALVAIITLLINGPHYGATIVRVYDAREDRRKYVYFSVYATIALAVAFAASTHSLWISSFLITLYVTWSPWHFSGQNYGLTLMFLRRRQIDVDSTTKRLIYSSFVLSALLAIVAVHGGSEGFVFAPATLRAPNTPTVMLLRLPGAFATAIQLALLLAYVACLAGAAWRLRRRARLRDLAPALMLVLTQALWFTVPAMLAAGTPVRASSLVFATVWVNAAHSLQYLWVTSYYARSAGPGTPVNGFLLRSFVAGTAVTTLPGLVLAPHLLGAAPWDAGLAATLFSVVNLHHFVLDGAIWKLRDGRIANVLLRAPNRQDRAEVDPSSGRSPWLRRLVWAVAAASIMIPVLHYHETSAIRSAKRADRVDEAIRVLNLIGRETVEIQVIVGERYASIGNHERAIQHYRRSIQLFPTGRAWAGLGGQHFAQGDPVSALAAFDAAIALNPMFYGAHFGRAQALLAIDEENSSNERRAEAIAALEQAIEIEPGYARAAQRLARVHTEDGRTDLAILVLEEALEVADPSAAPSLRAQMEGLRP